MSEYNMSHTGQELDEAIRKVKEGYVLPTEEININSNVSNMDITNGKTLNVNVPNTSPAFVTETVYPLSSKENYTGVEVPILQSDKFAYRKVSDEVYTQRQLLNQPITYNFLDSRQPLYSTIKQLWDVSENGSFCNGTSLVVVTPKDVGKTLDVDEFAATFPEQGTYLLVYFNDHYIDVSIAGTYKREVEAHDFDVIVEGELAPETFNVISLNREYQEIAEALRLKKDVRLLLNIPLGEDNVMTVLGTVETFRPNEGMIEFGVMLDTTLNQADGEQVYHFRITLWEDESVSTVYKDLSGGGSDEKDNSLKMCLRLNWDSLTAQFPTKDHTGSFEALSFQDIYQSVIYNNNIKTSILWNENNNEYLYRTVFSSDIAYFIGFEDDGGREKKQIIISAILNIDVRDGSGKQDYYFKFILNEDNTVTTEYQLIGGGSGSQEADLVINLLEGENSEYDGSGNGYLNPEYMSCDWEDAVNTLNKCRNGENVKIVLKGMYFVHSGGACPIYCDTFSVMAYGDILYVYALLPSWLADDLGICKIELRTNEQYIRIDSKRLGEIN